MTETIDTTTPSETAADFEELVAEAITQGDAFPSAPFAHVGSAGAAMVESVIGMLARELNAMTWRVAALVRRHDEGALDERDTFGDELTDLLDYRADLSRTVDSLRCFHAIMPSVIEADQAQWDVLSKELESIQQRFRDELEGMGVKVTIVAPGFGTTEAQS